MLKTTLVTGGAGFIGSHLVDHLVNMGAKVIVIDDLSNGSLDNLSSNIDSVDFKQGDITDYKFTKSAIAEADTVFHMAAVGSVPKSVADPDPYNSVNILGTYNVLKAAREASIERLIFSSSSSVYGPITSPRQQETIYPNPASPYALSKLTGEHYSRLFFELYDLPTICLRYFNVYGPRQKADSDYAAVIPKFINKLTSQEQPIIYGDGEQSRDFTYVENVVTANLAAAETSEQAFGKCYNIAHGETTTVNSLFRALQREIGGKLEPRHLQSRPGDIRYSHADIGRAKQDLLWEPEISFYQGLQATVQWWLRKT